MGWARRTWAYSGLKSWDKIPKNGNMVLFFGIWLLAFGIKPSSP